MSWFQQAYVKASNTGVGDKFGDALGLDDDVLAVGARNEESCARGVDGNQGDNMCSDAGAVYMFDRSDASWSQQAYLKALNADPGDQFGTRVALSGEALAVGANNENSCTNGTNGVEDDNGCDKAGAVYLFARSTSLLWGQQAYLKASNTDAGDLLGTAVALFGETLAVGATAEQSCAMGIGLIDETNGCNNAGAVYVFR